MTILRQFFALFTHLDLLLTAPLAGPPSPAPRPDPGTAVLANDNRAPAGRFENGVLWVSLEARRGLWHAEGESGPGFEIEAFGEEDRPLQSPGPLLRVPAGAEVRATVHNALARPMVLRGLHDRAGGMVDSLSLEPGERREIRFRATTPGTYYYWGRTSDDRRGLGIFEDGQLLGAFVVDPSGGASPPPDRVLVIQLWVQRGDTVPPVQRTFLVNGRSWPHTERLAATVGDTMRLRVINASVAPHPMHLHGFYFRIDARGTTATDTGYAEPQRRLAVTELLRPGTTMAMAWTPTRPGNWLFHCHFIAHIDAAQHLGEPAGRGGPRDHALNGMAGLVTGIEVHTRGAAGGDEGGAAAHIAPRRQLRLYANALARYFGERPGFGFVLQEGGQPPAADSIRIPGSPIVLTRGEPVEITVVNRTPDPITVHWHGIELDSYYDGVAGWSGDGDRVAPSIAPGDSFLVRMTPDRAGTFIYHTHNEESEQLASGLYGPLVVLEPGTKWDPERDRIFLLGWGGPGETAPPFLNGTAAPAPVQLRAGWTYRFRLINITPSHNQRVRVLTDTVPVAWRRFAKDGALVPPSQATLTPADQFLGAGETYDFELTPVAAGTLTLEVTTFLRGGRPPAVMAVPLVIRL